MILSTKRQVRLVNLQLFAGEKTEKATPKRRAQARKKGQVLQSREIDSALVLLSIFVGLKLFGKGMFENIYGFTRMALTEYPKKEDLFSLQSIMQLFQDVLVLMLKIVGPIFAIALIVGTVVSYLQVGSLFTLETLQVKFSKLNPISGFKRLFSIRGVVELVKSILKITVVGYVAYLYIRGETNTIMQLMDMAVMDSATYIVDAIITVGIRICIAFLVLAALDYIYQWWQYEKGLKMSKEDIKEEHKQAEGNPEVKSKIRQKQRQISMMRMLADVPKADVVITNPTHFAIALRYDPKISDAPMVIAKGADFIAKRIREIAKENGVEIVENKPLARSLYDMAEVGQVIPQELYQAVAEVLAFVYSLKGKDRAG